jgi:hypothetical protein
MPVPESSERERAGKRRRQKIVVLETRLAEVEAIITRLERRVASSAQRCAGPASRILFA